MRWLNPRLSFTAFARSSRASAGRSRSYRTQWTSSRSWDMESKRLLGCATSTTTRLRWLQRKPSSPSALERSIRARAFSCETCRRTHAPKATAFRTSWSARPGDVSSASSRRISSTAVRSSSRSSVPIYLSSARSSMSSRSTRRRFGSTSRTPTSRPSSFRFSSSRRMASRFWSTFASTTNTSGGWPRRLSLDTSTPTRRGIVTRRRSSSGSAVKHSTEARWTIILCRAFQTTTATTWGKRSGHLLQRSDW